MSYTTEIEETQQNTFAELYKFECGAVINRYTSHVIDVNYLGDIYAARPVKRGDFSLTEKLRSIQVRITAPIDATLAKYVGNAPVEPVKITITRVFIDSQEAKVIFQGEIIDLTLSGNAASAVCENETDIFRNKIPKRVFQARCNHMLFDSGCGLAEITWRVTATVTVSGSDLVSATFNGYSDGYFTGGHVEKGNDLRLITKHVGDTITLQVPFPQSTLETGDSVFAYPGCDKSASTCKTKFSNFANFLGMTYIPSSNPVIWGWK